MPQATDRRLELPLLILAAGCVVLAVNLGARQTMGLFLEPMTLAKGWSRESFGIAIGLQNLFWGAAQPFAGALAERYGTGRMIVASTLVYAVGLLLLAYAESSTALYLSGGVLVGVGIAGSAFPIVFGAVARAVAPERRSVALGIASAGGSFGQFVFVPLTQAMIDGVDWFPSLLVLAGIVAAVALLARPLVGRSESAPAGSIGLSAALKEAAANNGYRYLTAGFFVCGFHVAFIAVHIKPYVALCGLTPMIGATALALIGLFNIAGSFSAGVLGARFHKAKLLAGIYFARAVVIGIFLLAPKTNVTVLTFASVFGLLWLSTVPLTSGLIAQVFGARYLATLFGVAFFSHQIGAFFGSWLGGLDYDLTGSYDAVWVVSLLLGLLAAALHWPISDAPVGRPVAEVTFAR
jgi:predicted MFS family arabinose efflux permease